MKMFGGTMKIIMTAILMIQCAATHAGVVSFGPERRIAYIQDGTGLDASDMDGDGYVDIVYSHTSQRMGPSTQLGKNNGASSPAFISSSIGSGNVGFFLKSADLNHDGTRDLIGVSKLGGLYWFESKGNPPVFTPRLIRSKSFGFLPFCIADVDSDGDQDLIGANGRSVLWLENDGGAQPIFTDHAITTFTANCRFMTAGDLDNDGDTDIVIALLDSSLSVYKTYWLENDGAKPPQFKTHVLAERYTGTVSIVDFNRDGRPDVLLGGNCCENDGAKPPGFIFHNAVGGQWIHSAPGDFNGDGWMDYISYCEEGLDTQAIWWFENNRQASPSFTTHFVIGTLFSNEPFRRVYLIDVVVADVDRDGDVEPVLLQNNVGVIWFPNLRLSPRPVSLYKPNSGEQFLSGADVPVSWRTDVAQAGTTVTLDLWRGTGQRVAELAAADASPIGVGFHNIRLPVVTPGNDYRVRAVSLLNPALFAFSDGPFTISSASPISPKYWLHYR